MTYGLDKGMEKEKSHILVMSSASWRRHLLSDYVFVDQLAEQRVFHTIVNVL